MQGATPLIQDHGRQREQAQELMFFFSCIAGMGSSSRYGLSSGSTRPCLKKQNKTNTDYMNKE